MSRNLLSNRVNELRASLHLPQKQIAEMLGVNAPMYSRMEKGERFIKYDYLIPLSKLLGVNIEELRSLWLADKILGLKCDISEKTLTDALVLIKQVNNGNK